MSNLTTFFPAAGGGGGGNSGGLVSDPRDLPATLANAYRLQTKINTTSAYYPALINWYYIFIGNGSGGNANIGNGGIKSAFNLDFASISVNTYGTIADVTSTTGGIMRFCMGPTITLANGTSYTFKITVDGTVYEIPGTVNNNYNVPSYKFIPFLGFTNQGNANVNQTAALTGMNNPSNSYYPFLPSSTSSSTNAAIDSGQYFMYGYDNYQWIPANLAAMGGLKYKESLKVEFKCSAYASNIHSLSSRGLSVIANFDDIN